jgi:hypothetical protein
VEEAEAGLRGLSVAETLSFLRTEKWLDQKTPLIDFVKVSALEQDMENGRKRLAEASSLLTRKFLDDSTFSSHDSIPKIKAALFALHAQMHSHDKAKRLASAVQKSIVRRWANFRCLPQAIHEYSTIMKLRVILRRAAVRRVAPLQQERDRLDGLVHDYVMKWGHCVTEELTPFLTTRPPAFQIPEDEAAKQLECFFSDAHGELELLLKSLERADCEGLKTEMNTMKQTLMADVAALRDKNAQLLQESTCCSRKLQQAELTQESLLARMEIESREAEERVVLAQQTTTMLLRHGAGVIRALREDCSSSSDAAARALATCAAREAENAKLQAEHAELNRRCIESRSELEAAAAREEKLKDENNTVRKSRDDQHSEIVSLTRQIEDLKTSAQREREEFASREAALCMQLEELSKKHGLRSTPNSPDAAFLRHLTDRYCSSDESESLILPFKVVNGALQAEHSVEHCFEQFPRDLVFKIQRQHNQGLIERDYIIVGFEKIVHGVIFVLATRH